MVERVAGVEEPARGLVLVLGLGRRRLLRVLRVALVIVEGVGALVVGERRRQLVIAVAHGHLEGAIAFNNLQLLPTVLLQNSSNIGFIQQH